MQAGFCEAVFNVESNLVLHCSRYIYHLSFCVKTKVTILFNFFMNKQAVIC